MKFFSAIRAVSHLTLSFILLVSPAGFAANHGEAEINGLLIDQTRTLMGHEFYRHFCTLWGEPQVDFQYNVTIKEIPDARWGSLITVDVNGTTAYRKSLRPRSGKAEEEAKASISRVKKHLIYMIKTNGKQNSQDLKGNGF